MSLVRWPVAQRHRLPSHSHTVTLPTPGGAPNLTRIAESTGTVYYVNGSTGNDSNTSTQAQNPSTPWLTITNAIAQLASIGVTTIAGGPVIEVAAGTYTEVVQPFQAGVSGDATHVLTIRGAAGSRPIIQHIANNAAAVRLDGSYNRIRNFEVKGTTQTTAGGDGATLCYSTGNCSFVEWDNVIAHDMVPRTHSTGGQRVSGFFNDGTTNVQHWNCQAYNIDPASVGDAVNSHGWYIASSNSYRINCVAHHCPNGFGFQSYNGGSISPRPVNTGEIQCTAAFCDDGILVDDNYANYVAANCILANNSQYGIRGFSSGVGGGSCFITNSLTFSNTSAPILVDAGSPLLSANMATGDPKFTSSTDLHIASGSAATSVGSLAYESPTDQDGLSWVTVDAGAYRTTVATPVNLTPSAAAITAATAPLTARALLAPSAQAVTAATALVTAQTFFTESAAAVTAASAPLTAATLLTPTAAAVTSATASLTAASLLAPTAAAVTSATASLTARTLLSPSAQAVTAASAPVTAQTFFTASAQAVTAASALVTAATFVAPDPAQAVTSASASVTIAMLLSPSARATTAATTLVTAASLLTPAAAATTSATALATAASLLSPSAQATTAATCTVTASGVQFLIPAATGVSAASELLTAAAFLGVPPDPTANSVSSASASVTTPSSGTSSTFRPLTGVGL